MIVDMEKRTDETPDAEQLAFDYAVLDADTRMYVYEREQAIHRAARRSAKDIVEIGQLLTEAKDKLKHGQFRKWIDKCFGWSYEHAVNFMRVYQHFKNVNFTDLIIDISALFVIAAPRASQPVREEVIRRAEAGEKITYGVAKQVLEEEKKKLRERLPSPAKARESAIETGKHTLDYTGIYQPPMTVEDQERRREERQRITALLELTRWAEVEHDPAELLDIADRLNYQPQLRSVSLNRVIEWLTTFEHHRSNRYEKHSKTKPAN